MESGTEMMHIGIARRSGRYPWGSGEDPYQRSLGFRKFQEEMKSQGISEKQILEILNAGYDKREHISSTDWRAGIASSTAHINRENVNKAMRLAYNSDGSKRYGPSKIAELMSTPEHRVNESTVRGWLAASEKVKKDSLFATRDALLAQLKEKPYLDVGAGTELHMGVSKTRLNMALALLRDEGYQVHNLPLPQLGTGKNTNTKMLTGPDVTWGEAVKNIGRMQNVTAYSADIGASFANPTHNPVSLNMKRLEVRYGNEGGAKMDGVIELRRGVEDLDLGDKRYAQIRMAVNDSHYLKGMAIYADDLPAGVDVRFNTNKNRDDPKVIAEGDLGTMKPLKSAESGNRFGATTYPREYTDKSGKKKTSPLNIVNEEGAWDDWSKSLSSQMLSKQPVALANQQLQKTRDKKLTELREINSLTNPVVKQKLLQEFADSADAAAVHLKAAALDRQATKVLLPMNSMRPNEIFAPDFEHGERVALVRYPHGGKFEIPELTVNNRNITARRIMGGARDAVGIHHSVAERLSGADFDGDTVLVIPNNSGAVKSQDAKVGTPLGNLRNFDPKAAYPEVPGMTYMTKRNTQTEMGRVSNLITDMTIKGAKDEDIAAAVRHSMVVIDAEKHKLNYKQSEIDNGISRLKREYQGKAGGGASTIISRASSDARVPERRLARQGAEGGPIDPKTGKLRYVNTGAQYPERKKDKVTGQYYETGRMKDKETTGTKMEFVDDAHKLVSGPDAPRMERIYADHANAMKSLANQARLDMLAANDVIKKEYKKSPAAEVYYAKEVESLKHKLKVAQRNAPLERQAQAIGNLLAKQRIDANPQYEKDEIKRVKFQALDEGRRRTGAGKIKIGADDGDHALTSREWEAIQSKAISPTMLREILANANMDRVRQLATPKPTTSLTPGQQARIDALRAAQRSPTEIAEALGIPRSTVVDHIKG